ncbi:hypothetical protein ACIQM3_07395 [Streptomyces sp. NPDC091271]|uniref:hypothetical protein n=1 Tax=Streptomyces sp. NPDC091271 TaxID=3365980 RepID=UPI003820FD70
MYDELYERYLESDDVVVPPAPRIVAYVEALVANRLRTRTTSHCSWIPRASQGAGDAAFGPGA